MRKMVSSNLRFLFVLSFSLFFCFNSNAKDLPSYVIPEIHSHVEKKTLIVFISGDGGYNKFSKSILEYFTRDGYSKLIFDSKKYFWEAKTPEIASRDFEGHIRYFLEKSGCKNFYIIGHSFSAGVLPFIINNFSDDLKSKVRRATFLSPDRYASLEVTLSTMLNWKQKPNGYEVLPEVLKIKHIPSTYVFCKDGEQHLIALFRQRGLSVRVLEGPHNYNRDFPAIYNVIQL